MLVKVNLYHNNNMKVGGGGVLLGKIGFYNDIKVEGGVQAKIDLYNINLSMADCK